MNATELVTEPSQQPAPLRPPWALPEWVFRQRCDGCGACVDACREGILTHDRDGLPITDFRFGGCDFCGECVTACPKHALRASGRERFEPFRFRLQINQECLAKAGEPCRTCTEFCDSYAIRFVDAAGAHQCPSVDASRCNGCGHCVGPCPVNAIQLRGLPMPGVN